MTPPFPPSQLRIGCSKTADSFGVTKDGKGFFQPLKVFCRHQNSRGAAVDGHRHPLVVIVNAADELGEMRAVGCGDRGCRRHGCQAV